MEDVLDMNEIYEHFGCETDFQKMCASELVFLVLRDNNCGVTGDNTPDVRKALYGDNFGSLEEQVISVAGYWSNDLEIILEKNVGYGGKIFRDLFELLSGKHVEGLDTVGYKLEV